MSTALTPRPRQLAQKKLFAIVASTFNAELVQGLVDHAAAEIESLAPASQILLKQVPGAFEIPIVAAEVIDRYDVTAVIALGVILDGETAHGTLIAESVTHALARLAVDMRVPIIHEVLFCKTEEQAKKRCLSDEKNRGTDAARAAVEMAEVIAELKLKPKH